MRVQSNVESRERLVNHAVDLDPFAQGALATPQRPLPWNAYLADAWLTRSGLDPIDQLADLLLEVVEAHKQFGFEHHEQVTVVLVGVERRSGKYPERLHDEREPKPLVAPEGEQRAEPCHRRVARGLAFGIDRHTFGQQLTEPLAECPVGPQERRSPHVEYHRPLG